MRPCPSCGEPNSDPARYCAQCGSPLGTVGGARERKGVTALFCDLVGSTDLGERLDPETLRLVLDTYFDAARTAVDRHEGRIEKFIGDAVAAVFGIPVAHEDDALRAARAALELQRSMADVNTRLAPLGVTLAIRVGLQSGDVLVDPSSPHVPTVGGDTFNTAARLQAQASPGEVVVGSGAAALLGSSAVLEPLPPMTLRGRARPEPAYRLVDVRTPGRPDGTAPFVGRVRQLEALRAAFRDCVEDGAVVLVTVVGEPGIGKSRLVDRLAAELAGDATVLVGTTPTYGPTAAYAPVLDLLRAAARSQDAEAVVTTLRDLVGDQPDARPVVDRLAALLLAEDPSVAGDTTWALRRLLESLAGARPVVAVVEDVHLGGDALLDLLDRVASSVRGPVLVVCTARPELLEQRPSWGGGKARALTVTLGPLPVEQADQLARHLLGDGRAGSRRRLTAAAEGNPLYLEQLAAMVREAAPDDDVLHTPPTLRALLAARLDRLDALEWRVVEMGAIEGREFQPDVVRLLAPELEAKDVLAALDRLERRSLVRPGAAAGSFRFAHALVHDAVSHRTAKGDRARLHVALAEHLADHPSGSAAPEADVGAHLERAAALRRELGFADAETAGLEVRAGRSYAAAGSRAYASMDLPLAAELLGRAAELLPSHEPSRVSLLPDLGVALMEVGRTDEAERLLRSEGAGGADVGTGDDAVQRARAEVQLLALRGVYRGLPSDDVERCLEEGARIVAVLERLGDPTALAEGYVLLEYLEWVLGRVSRAVDACVRAVRASQAAGRVREQWQAGGDLGLYLAAGFLPADRVGPMVASLVAEPAPIWRLAVLAATATARAYDGDRDGFAHGEDQWAALADSHGLEWPRAQQAIGMALAWSELGDDAAAEAWVRLALDGMERMGDLWSQASAAWLLPVIVGRQGRYDEALALVDRAAARAAPFVLLDAASRVCERMVAALGYRLRGRTAEAQSAALTAVELAGPTELAVLRTQALEQLAEVLDEASRREEARDVRERALNEHLRAGNRVGAARVTALLR